MFQKNKLFMLFSIFVINGAIAVFPTEPSVTTMSKSAAVPLLVNNISTSVQTPQVSTMQPQLSNLSSIDSNADDLIKLKRKLELEKAEAELKKLKNSGSSEATGSHMDNAQTVVTGVAINQDGRKIAWLQFTDRGTLTVNVGSKIGKYTVSDINMNGVTISYFTGRKRLVQHDLFLRRTYYVDDKPTSQSNNAANPFFTPSPVVTGANTASVNDMVPPIVPVR